VLTPPVPDPDLKYLRRTSAGAEYVRQITAVASDRRARSAFRELVLRVAPPGAALFDFGAGPGIDARFFAERGFSIEAYDVDPRMREYFADYCRDLMEAGRVMLDCSGYREFVTRAATAEGRVDLVISNFAPLNLVDDLHELFAKFHTLTRANGRVLASVLNPFFIGEMHSRWWWQAAPRLLREGQFFMPGPQAPHYKRLPGYFRAVTAPYFRLQRVFRGLSSRYLFLLFEKRDGGIAS
jgi:SAM-dependent methyltransferase